MDFITLIESAGAGFEPIPNGSYSALVQQAEVSQTSNGKLMFKLTWQITEGPYANRKVWSNMVVSPESPPALGIMFKHMAALGLDAEFFKAGPSPDQVANAMNGKGATLVVDQREWNGEIRNEVKNIVKKAGGIVPSAPTPTTQSAPPGIPAPASTPAPQQTQQPQHNTEPPVTPPGAPPMPF